MYNDYMLISDMSLSALIEHIQLGGCIGENSIDCIGENSIDCIGEK